MSEIRQKRIRRTPQERAAEIDTLIQKQNHLIEDLEERKKAAVVNFDEKIASVQARIKELESKKAGILAPKTAKKPRKSRKQKIQEILKEAQKQGMKPEEIADRLGLKVEDQK